jgi:ribosomal subunit interface protein
MNVRFTGRHVGIVDEDRDWARAKIEALHRYHRRLLDLEVRVMLDGKGRERVELEADLGRQRFVAHSDAPGFRAALDGAVEVLKRRLLRDKEKVVDRRRRPARKGAARGAANEDGGLPR